MLKHLLSKLNRDVDPSAVARCKAPEIHLDTAAPGRWSMGAGPRDHSNLNIGIFKISKIMFSNLPP